MIRDAPLLGDPGEPDPVFFVCPACGRSGRYRVATLIAQFGPDVGMPELLNKFARWRGCKLAENNDPYDPLFLSGRRCRVHYDIAKMRPDEVRWRPPSFW